MACWAFWYYCVVRKYEWSHNKSISVCSLAIVVHLLGITAITV